MKVTKFFPQIKTESTLPSKRGRETLHETGTSSGSDRVELSAGSKDAQKMQEILEQAPEVRADKVSALKERIERGEYHPEPRDVADRMLADLLSDDSPFA